MNIKKDDLQKNINKNIQKYGLLTYLILTSLIIIWAFLKKIILKTGPPNDPDKMIRLINFFWLIPVKIYLILNVFLALIELFVQVFSIIFVKQQGKHFPPAFLFFLNYGVLLGLIIYTLFPKYIWIIIAIFPVIGAIIGGVSVNPNESIFPYKFTNHGNKIFGAFEEFKNASGVLEQIWFLFVVFFYVCLFLLFVFSIGLLIIPLSYFIVLVYTFKIPTSS